MKPPPEALDEYRERHQEEFHEGISTDEAFDRFSRLIVVLRICHQRAPAPELDSPPSRDTIARTNE